MPAAVLLVNNVAADIAQGRLQHIENEFRPRRSARWAGAKLGAELMLMLGFGEVAQHVGRRAEKNEAPAFVEQDRLVKHLEELRARLMDRDNDDLVVREPADDLDDVLGVLRGKPGRRLVKKINVGRPNHVEADVEPFPLAAAQRFLDRTPHDAVAPLIQSELDQFAFQPAGEIASRKMRRANRGGELQILSDRKMLIESIFLRNVTDVALEQVQVSVERAVVQKHLSLRRLKLAAQDLHQRALARAARAHHADQLTAIDRERNAFERHFGIGEAMIHIHHLERPNDVALFLGGPPPNRWAIAFVATLVASPSLEASRASISLQSGVPWQ